jgi:hypothetical protein
MLAREVQEQARERDLYEVWLSMSDGYKLANPWCGKTLAVAEDRRVG